MLRRIIVWRDMMLFEQPYLNNFRSFKIRFAALCPGAPVTPPPGCEPEPHR